MNPKLLASGKRMPDRATLPGSSLERAPRMYAAVRTEAQCLVQIRLLFGEFDATTQVVRNELVRIGRAGCSQATHDSTIAILGRMLHDVDRRLTLMADAVARYGDYVDEACFEQLDARVRLLNAARESGMMADEFETPLAVLEVESMHLFELPSRRDLQ